MTKHRAPRPTFAQRLMQRSVRESVPIDQVKASRAVYISPDIQRIEVEFQIGSERILLDLSPDHAAKLITELTTAYVAIRPPLRNGQTQSSWLGMGG